MKEIENLENSVKVDTEASEQATECFSGIGQTLEVPEPVPTMKFIECPVTININIQPPVITDYAAVAGQAVDVLSRLVSDRDLVNKVAREMLRGV